MATRKPQSTSITNVAAASLAKTGHSVFATPPYKVMSFGGIDVEDNWTGTEITDVTVHAPTLVNKQWRAHFWPNKFYAFMSPDMTREEAMQAAESLRQLTNIRRKGG